MDWAAAQREVMIVSRRAPVVVWKVWNNGNGLVMERSIIRLVRKWQSAFVSFSLTACLLEQFLPLLFRRGISFFNFGCWGLH